jgi:peroxiredoxin
LERYEGRRAELEAKNARIAAISVDPIDVSQDLADRLHLGFPILADEGGAVARAYGVWHAERKIALPAVIVIGRGGVVRWRRVSRSVTDRPDEDDVVDVVSRLPR